jgi:hypothetical protein
MTFKDLQDAVYNDLSTTSSDTFFTATLVKSYINRQIKRVAGLYPWPHTKIAEIRDSVANQEWYNYPEDWVQDSIYRLTYNDLKYNPTDFDDFEDLKIEKDKCENRFANFENKYFLDPIPSAAIVGGISIWGHKLPATLSADADVNPFSEDPEIEEEIINLTRAMLMQKQRGSYLPLGRVLEADTLAKLTAIWKKTYMKKAKFMTKTRSMFKPIDILSQPSNRSLGSRPGNF